LQLLALYQSLDIVDSVNELRRHLCRLTCAQKWAGVHFLKSSLLLLLQCVTAHMKASFVGVQFNFQRTGPQQWRELLLLLPLQSDSTRVKICCIVGLNFTFKPTPPCTIEISPNDLAFECNYNV
jgi:hypothetical protein